MGHVHRASRICCPFPGVQSGLLRTWRMNADYVKSILIIGVRYKALHVSWDNCTTTSQKIGLKGPYPNYLKHLKTA